MPDDHLYVGDDEVSGTVVNRENEPLAGATVWWLPTMFFDGDTPQRSDRFTTTTDAAGRFAFQTLPHAPMFEIAAVGGDHGGYLSGVSQTPGAATKLTIITSRWAYSRYSFVDEAGEPVRVAGLRLSLKPGAQHSSFDPALDARTMWILARLGLPLQDVSDNEVAWTSVESYARKAQQRTLEVPGYEPVILDGQCLSASDWPSGRQVVLTQTPLPPGKCIYEVEFQALHEPVEWQDVQEWGGDIEINVTWSDSKESQPVSPRRNRFVGERGRPFTLGYRLSGLRTDSDIAYTQETRGDTVVVRPQLPDLAYVSIYYTEGAKPGGRRCRLYLDHTGNGARILWPGYARIGPLPAGPYLLWRWWIDDPRVDTPDKMEVTLKPGHNVVRW